MENKIKIAMVVGKLEVNGISAVIMNYCRNIDLNKFELTILSGKSINHNYYKECEELGIKIIVIPDKNASTIKYFNALLKEFSKNKYDILHVHGNSSLMAIELFAGLIKGIKVRIAHCHNSQCTHFKVHKLLKGFFNKVCTQGFACSSLAGEWLFDKVSYTVIPNGFNVEEFKFDSNLREKTRNELNIKDAYIIGHVGRFNDQKNQSFLLKVFELVAHEEKNAFLLLVGDGPYFERIDEMVKKHPFKDRIIMYGETLNTAEVYNAMDFFTFPSKYEGLGIVILEAQINGLKCIASDKVPKDVEITQNVKFIGIEENNIKEWADSIVENIRDDLQRTNIDINSKEIQNFNIIENVKLLENKYIEFRTSNKK